MSESSTTESPESSQSFTGTSSSQTHPEREYINCPFVEKDQAKDLGARWDGEKKKWYIPANCANRADFARWLGAPSSPHKSPSKFKTPSKLERLADSMGQFLADNKDATKSSLKDFVSKFKAENDYFYLFVPFEEKDKAKHLGARWDSTKKRWYVPPGVDRSRFKEWENPRYRPMTAADEYSLCNACGCWQCECDRDDEMADFFLDHCLDY